MAMESPRTLADVEADYRLSDAIVINRAWDAYEGRYPAPLEIAPGHPDYNTSVNLCRKAVDSSVYLLYGKPFEWVLEGEQPAVRDWIDGFWTQNNRMVHKPTELALNGAIGGTLWAKLYVDARYQFPRVIALRPEQRGSVSAQNDWEDIHEYVGEWTEFNAAGEMVGRRQRTYRVAGGWETIDEIAEKVRGIDGRTKVIWRQLGPPELWEWPFAPIFHAQNLLRAGSVSGTPDIASDVIELNEKINRALTHIQKLVHQQSHRVPWISGVKTPDDRREKEKSRLPLVPERPIVLEDPSARAGVMDTIADLTHALENYRMLRAEFMTRTQTVDPSELVREGGGIGAVSGFAIQLNMAPALEKLEAKRPYQEALLVDLTMRAREISGVKIQGELKIAWPDPLPKSLMEQLDAAAKKKALGISAQTVMEELGYDPETESERLASEVEAQAVAALRHLEGLAGGAGA